MNKRKLHGKKGFTLVELMIVIVILGILVAVAIPVYSSVTKGVKMRACHTNCEVVEKAAQQYILDIESDTVHSITSTSITVTSPEDAAAKLPADFLKCFKNSKFPKCPSEDCVYTLYYDEETNGMTISVYCSTHGDLNGNKRT